VLCRQATVIMHASYYPLGTCHACPFPTIYYERINMTYSWMYDRRYSKFRKIRLTEQHVKRRKIIRDSWLIAVTAMMFPSTPQIAVFLLLSIFLSFAFLDESEQVISNTNLVNRG